VALVVSISGCATIKTLDKVSKKESGSTLFTVWKQVDEQHNNATTEPNTRIGLTTRGRIVAEQNKFTKIIPQLRAILTVI
jgi:uncharacterized protein YceK